MRRHGAPATGSFGRFQGYAFMEMVDRKVRWILEHLGELFQAADVQPPARLTWLRYAARLRLPARRPVQVSLQGITLA